MLRSFLFAAVLVVTACSSDPGGSPASTQPAETAWEDLAPFESVDNPLLIDPDNGGGKGTCKHVCDRACIKSCKDSGGSAAECHGDCCDEVCR